MSQPADAVPEAVARTLRSLAAAVPDYPGDLAAVTRRVAARRRRIVVTTSVAATLLVAAGIAIPYGLARGGGSTSEPPATSTTIVAPPPAGPQRLMFATGRVTSRAVGSQSYGLEADPNQPNFGYPDGAYGWVSVGGVKEVLADGSVVTHPTPPLTETDWVYRPDGRFVALVSQGVAPGDGSPWNLCAELHPAVLEVYDGPGAPALSRQVPVPDPSSPDQCTHVDLVGASVEEAFLVRTEPTRSTLVALRFADGAQREIGQVGYMDDYNLAADRGALGTGLPCVLMAVKLTTGETVAQVNVSPELGPDDYLDGCRIGEVRISPDGRYVAMSVTQNPRHLADFDEPMEGRTQQVRLKVLDLTTGLVVVDDLLYEPTLRSDWSRDLVLDLAWPDGATVRVAFVNLPEPVFSSDGLRALNLDVYAVEDVLQLRTVHI